MIGWVYVYMKGGVYFRIELMITRRLNLIASIFIYL